ncbi:MAG TPA: sigma-70 family RNA polymerase sigma factor [Verrucomicrobiae bacterium]|nr:sigma-70 family RNA polymerase sigma factor [Verrucomicrobiae bacterium]
MPESDDIALLKEYAASGSEAAFTALVGRHVNLVYSVALRRVGNTHAAEEIAQAVFLILARKAKSLTGGWSRRLVASVRFRGDGGVAATPLSGWLYQTARLTAANYLRGEIRRQHREQEATMQSILNEAEAEPEVWRQIAPLLDDAMGRLGKKDRNAIVLRFFENKNLAEVGTALGTSEDAAKMRVNRALEKLRKLFSKRGVDSTATAIAENISANSVHIAPVGLAKVVSAAALAKGATASISTLTIVKGALKIMAWTKAKTAVVAGLAVILSVGTYTVIDHAANMRTADRGNQILAEVIAANRLWLLAPPDKVTDYSYVFHLQWDKAPGGFIVTPVQVSNPRNAPASERQGITYSSLLQRLVGNPDLVRVQSVTEEGGRITLALKFLPAPGARTTQVIGGMTIPIPPLRISCGNGIKNNWRGEFQTGGTNAVLVVDAAKMVPLDAMVSVPGGTVEESFSDYSEVQPGSYAPLSVTIKYADARFPQGLGNLQFAWKFKLHDGLWLFDESQYRGEKVAWTDQVAVNQPTGNPVH